MSRAVLIDNQTVVVAAEGKMRKGQLEDLAGVLTDKTALAVVPCEMVKIVAGSEEGLHREAPARLPQGMVYCYQKLTGTEFQVFAIPEQLLQQLRAVPAIQVVQPYGVAVAEAKPGSLASETTMVSRPGSGKSFLGGGSDEEKSELAVLDAFGDRTIITVLVGNEIKVVRTLHPEDELARELFVTLQGVNLPDARLVTASRSVYEALTEEGQAVNLVRLPLDSPTIGLLGLRKPSNVRFYTPGELARRRRQSVRRRLWGSVILAAAFLTACIAAAGAATVRTLWAERAAARIREEYGQSQLQLAQLYRERYAAWIAGRAFNVPQAWAELEMMIPPQLEVKEVSIDEHFVRALLVRRKVEVDQGDPPLTLKEVETAVERMASWRGATVQLAFDSHDVNYQLEKPRGFTRN